MSNSSRVALFYRFIMQMFGNLEYMERGKRIKFLFRILRCINSCVFLPTESKQYIFFEPLLKSLKKNFDQDSEIVISSIQELCGSPHLTSGLLEHMIDADHLEFALFHARRMKCTYYTLWEGVGDGYDASEFHLTHLVTRFAGTTLKPFYTKALPVLFKYGFRFRFQEYAYRMLHTVLLCISFGGRYIEEYSIFVLLGFKRRELMALYIFLICAIYKPKRRKRLLLCISRAEPDPFITPWIMYDTLRKVLIPDRHSHLWNACLQYEDFKVYDDSYSIYRPRRLSHLARCAIRERLANNRQLPDGIEDLGLPEKMKPYLYLKE